MPVAFLLEGNPSVAAFVVEILRNEGFEVIAATSPDEVSESAHLMILDESIPGAIARAEKLLVRSEGAGVIRLVSGRERKGRATLARPFSDVELRAAITASRPRDLSDDHIRLGRAVVDLKTRRITWGDHGDRLVPGRDVCREALDGREWLVPGRDVCREALDGREWLTAKEALLLGYLAARPGESVSRDSLHEQIWGYSADVISRAVDCTMRRLRNKVESDPDKPRHLITVRGVGYRFVPETAETEQLGGAVIGCELRGVGEAWERDPGGVSGLLQSGWSEIGSMEGLVASSGDHLGHRRWGAATPAVAIEWSRTLHQTLSGLDWPSGVGVSVAALRLGGETTEATAAELLHRLHSGQIVWTRELWLEALEEQPGLEEKIPVVPASSGEELVQPSELAGPLIDPLPEALAWRVVEPRLLQLECCTVDLDSQKVHPSRRDGQPDADGGGAAPLSLRQCAQTSW